MTVKVASVTYVLTHATDVVFHSEACTTVLCCRGSRAVTVPSKLGSRYAAAIVYDRQIYEPCHDGQHDLRVLKCMTMRYLTHLLLFDLSRDRRPARRKRDNFGLDSAACWCCCMSEHTVPSSHAHPPPILDKELAHTIDSHEGIELASLASKASLSPTDSVTSDLATRWQTQAITHPAKAVILKPRLRTLPTSNHNIKQAPTKLCATKIQTSTHH